MAYIKHDGKVHEVKVTPSGNIVTLAFQSGAPVLITSGFNVYLDLECKMILGKYPDHKTVHRNDDTTALYNGYQLSNDGSVYIAPVPKVTFSASTGGSLEGELIQEVTDFAEMVIPTPVPDENYEFIEWQPEIKTEGEIESDLHFTAVFTYVPTLEDLKAGKIAEMKNAKISVLTAGFEATLTNGTVEHFDLFQEDMLYLTALQTQVLAGTDPIPWHVSDESVPCKFYSNKDMGIITQTALNLVMYHETYIKDINRYITSIETKEELEKVQYGMILPDEFKSEPISILTAAQNT